MHVCHPSSICHLCPPQWLRHSFTHSFIDWLINSPIHSVYNIYNITLYYILPRIYMVIYSWYYQWLASQYTFLNNNTPHSEQRRIVLIRQTVNAQTRASSLLRTLYKVFDTTYPSIRSPLLSVHVYIKVMSVHITTTWGGGGSGCFYINYDFFGVPFFMQTKLSLWIIEHWRQ